MHKFHTERTCPELAEGFTLIELLLVISIIAILAVTILVALNPPKRFMLARDARRATDVETILSAIHLYASDNAGSFPTGMSTSMAERQLGTATSGCTISSGGCNVTNDACLDLSTLLAPYLKNVPIDPSLSTSSTITGYSVVENGNNIVTIRACKAEAATFSSSR